MGQINSIGMQLKTFRVEIRFPKVMGKVCNFCYNLFEQCKVRTGEELKCPAKVKGLCPRCFQPKPPSAAAFLQHQISACPKEVFFKEQGYKQPSLDAVEVASGTDVAIPASLKLAAFLQEVAKKAPVLGAAAPGAQAGSASFVPKSKASVAATAAAAAKSPAPGKKMKMSLQERMKASAEKRVPHDTYTCYIMLSGSHYNPNSNPISNSIHYIMHPGPNHNLSLNHVSPITLILTQALMNIYTNNNIISSCSYTKGMTSPTKGAKSPDAKRMARADFTPGALSMKPSQ